MNRETRKRTARNPEIDGRLALYHANTRATGSALKLELKINRKSSERYDCFFLEMARQKTAERGKNGRTQATFDWESKAIVKLDFLDICEFLMVLEGKSDQAGGKRSGIYHEVDGMNTIIVFRKDAERSGYFLGISRKSAVGEQVFKGHFILTQAEAVGLASIFRTGLFFMVFHSNVRAAC